MRQPTIRRRRTRQQRLMRTAIALVALVGLAAVVGALLGEDSPIRQQDPDLTQVAFTGAVAAYPKDAPRAADKTVARDEAEAIWEMLNDWYARGFVDPEQFSDGEFPEIAARFAASARPAFARDLNALTIGEARTEVTRVEPQESVADVSLYFASPKAPTLAVAKVRFTAVAQTREGVPGPLELEQSVTLHLEKQSKEWVVVYYESEQNQRSVQQPAGSPSP